MSALHEEDRFGNILPVSLLSRVTYRWINKTLNHGNRSQLQEKDLLKLREKESSQCLIEVLEMSWKEEEHLGGTDPDRKGLLLRALFKVMPSIRVSLLMMYQYIDVFNTMHTKKGFVYIRIVLTPPQETVTEMCCKYLINA